MKDSSQKEFDLEVVLSGKAHPRLRLDRRDGIARAGMVRRARLVHVFMLNKSNEAEKVILRHEHE